MWLHYKYRDPFIYGSLYKKIYTSLKPSGFYIETDYMAVTQEFENFRFSENKRLRAEQGVSEGYFHYDTPYTVENQTDMLKQSGFNSIENMGRYGIDVILVARK